MDCCISDNISNQELDEIHSENSETFSGIKKNRKCTDLPALIGMGVFFFILIALLGYSLSMGDLNRVTEGYDDCGNVCGEKNEKFDFSPNCYGMNMTFKKYLLYQSIQREGLNYTTKTCVHDCKEEGAEVAFLNRCFRTKDDSIKSGRAFFEELSEDFQIFWPKLILLSFLTLVFSIIVMFLFRHATAFIVWFVLIGLSATCVGATIYFWLVFKWKNDELKNIPDFSIRAKMSEEVYAYLYFAIFATIFSVVILLIILIMRRKIALVIQILKEAAKALADMPMLFFQPVLTFVLVCVILFCGFFFSLWILTAGDLEKTNEYPVSYDYTPNAAVVFTTWYNYFAIVWIIQFVLGCQHMIIGGSVGAWYFSRNKTNMESPILTSITNVLKYHLGTIAYGALIITIVQIIKAIVRGIREKLRSSKSIIAWVLSFCLMYIVEWLQVLLKYFSRNAYIQTAIHGHSFCYGGKRAFKLLINNIFKVAAINSIGDYVLIFTNLFVAVFTVMIGYEITKDDKLHNQWFLLLLIGIISYFIANCFVTVYEMAIDTILLCFCEDCEQNDGLSKPYYMSRNLMEFVEKSNNLCNKNWVQTDQVAWENGPKRYLL